MKRYEKLLVGDKDKRDEILEVCLSIGITEEMLDRCSLIFIMQIYGTYMSRLIMNFPSYQKSCIR